MEKRERTLRAKPLKIYDYSLRSHLEVGSWNAGENIMVIKISYRKCEWKKLKMQNY